MLVLKFSYPLNFVANRRDYYHHVYINCTGVYLSLRDVKYANNSTISISEIGRTRSEALQCITDKSPCCRSQKLGEWLFPNGTKVPIEGHDSDGNAATTFFRNRYNGKVNLNRVNSHVTYPTGRFCCEVPDAINNNQTVCAIISECNKVLLYKYCYDFNLT